MVITGLVALLLVVGSAAIVLGLGRRHGWRWGEVPDGAVQAGEGAYREALVQTARPRGVPALVSWSAGLGYLWAALTFFIFAPAGLLLCLIVGEGPSSRLAPAVVAGLSLSGFGLAVMLVAAGTSLLRCRPNAAARAESTAWWSIAHHGVVLLVMAALSSIPRSDYLLVLSVVPCLLGWAHAFCLLKASRLPGPAVPNVAAP